MRFFNIAMWMVCFYIKRLTFGFEKFSGCLVLGISFARSVAAASRRSDLLCGRNPQLCPMPTAAGRTATTAVALQNCGFQPPLSTAVPLSYFFGNGRSPNSISARSVSGCAANSPSVNSARLSATVLYTS